jgi:CDK inhibitor PHO81
MEELLSKRRAAAMRGLPDITSDTTQNHVEWSAVEEGFRLLERDLGKLQVVIFSRLFSSFLTICSNS